MLEEFRITDPDGVTRDMTEAEIADVMALRQAAAAAAVPSSCSKLGLKRALDEMGQWAAVKAAIAADPAVQEEWDLATSLTRTDPLVAGMIAQLGMTEAQVDYLLIRAHALVS